jgi:hypothetical protein
MNDEIFDVCENAVLPFVTNFRVFPLWTLSVFRFTASTEMARHACVSTPSTSICDYNKHCYKYKYYILRNKNKNKNSIQIKEHEVTNK